MSKSIEASFTGYSSSVKRLAPALALVFIGFEMYAGAMVDHADVAVVFIAAMAADTGRFWPE